LFLGLRGFIAKLEGIQQFPQGCCKNVHRMFDALTVTKHLGMLTFPGFGVMGKFSSTILEMKGKKV
jgi:hypothetical protein